MVYAFEDGGEALLVELFSDTRDTQLTKRNLFVERWSFIDDDGKGIANIPYDGSVRVWREWR